MGWSSENVYIHFAGKSDISCTLYTFIKFFWIFRECLSGAIEHSDAPQVVCPYKDNNYSCDMHLLEREIKAVSWQRPNIITIF